MTRRTKKVRQTGRYGPRYGIRVRKQILLLEDKLRQKHKCPNCQHDRVKRISTGIWKCGKCELVFAGGAFVPKSASGRSRDLALRKIREAEDQERLGA